MIMKHTAKKKARNVTLDQLAEQLGISRSAVSLALNGKPGVSEATRETVMKCASELNYRVCLKGRKTDLIGVITPRLSDSFFREIAVGIEGAAAEHDYDVIIHAVERCRFKSEQVVKRLAEKVDGMIIVANWVRKEHYEAFLSRNIPVVCRGEEPGISLPSVYMDTRKACELVMNHLTGLGHREIVYCHSFSTYSQDRLRCTEEIARAKGLKLIPCAIEDEINIEKAFFGFSNFLEMGNRFTAVACSTDYIASGVLQALNRADIQVPHEVSLVGFDNLVWSKLLNPSLTTIQQPQLEQGEAAMHMLLELMKGKAVRNFMMEPSLIVRNSTAPVLSGPR